METIEAQYQAELKRSDQEHHTPTAGAMIGHITANLLIHSLKIEQATLFAKGPASLYLNQFGPSWVKQELKFVSQINQALLAEGDLIPTTTKQLTEFSMLEENGALKYASGDEQLFDLVKDFDTQLLFISRAIELTAKEKHFAENQLMQQLDGWIKDQIVQTQKFLGHDLREGLYQEEDDDE